MSANYLLDLELDLNADLEAVRKAYKALAKKFHPDHNPENQHAAERFRQITQAYRFLKTEEGLYQAKRSYFMAEVIRSESDAADLDRNSRRTVDRPRGLPRSHRVRRICENCKGVGNIRIERGAFRWNKTCEDCQGKGEIFA